MTIRLEKGSEKLIVMPLRPSPGQEPDGRGLGIHFLAGNLICLHHELLECWFGWRVKTIFPQAQSLLSYCGGSGEPMDFMALGKREAVRFWIEGTYTGDEAWGQVDLVLHDSQDGLTFERHLAYSHADGFLDFRHLFLDWLDQTGLGFSGRKAAFWPEKMCASGLDLLGQALRGLYVSYADGDTLKPLPIDLGVFKQSVTKSPDAYLAHTLLGWGLYKNGVLADAGKAFDAALGLNPSGMGAHAGRMWVAMAEKDKRVALHHALEKGRLRREDPAKTRAFVEKKLA